MNPDQPSREQIEARLTALLLGELPAAEAELLRWTIAQDPELQKLHDQLKLTIGFVREAMKNPAGASVEKETPLKLSQERRQTLLALFKTARPKHLIWLPRIKVSPLIPALAAVAVIVVLAAMLLPVLNIAKKESVNTESLSQSTASINNMRQVTAAVNEWALETGQTTASAVKERTITPNPQESTTTPPMARIVLPNTESSQNESQANAGPEVNSQNVVGYVNINPGASSSTLPQPEPNSEPPAVIASPPPASAAPPQLQRENASTVAEAAPPVSASPAPEANDVEQAREGLFPSSGENTAVNGNNFYGGRGAGGGTVAFQITNNTLSLSWPANRAGWQLQAQTNSLPVVFADSSKLFYRSISSSVRGNENQSALIARENQNAKDVNESAVGVPAGILNPATGLPESEPSASPSLPQQPVAENAPVATTFSPQQSQKLDMSQVETTRGQPYWELKLNLEDKIELHQLLAAKIESDEADSVISKTSLVTILNPAQPGQSQNLWQRLTGEVESQARIEVNPDSASDVPGFNGGPAGAYTPYDPYFLETEVKSIQSDAVLGQVVDTLKLDQTWSEQNGGEKLSRNDAIALLRSRLDLQADRNTRQIEIGAKSDKPDEAAQIANAVAEAYRQFRLEMHGQKMGAGIEKLKQDYAEEDRKISELQAKLQIVNTPPAAAPVNHPLIPSSGAPIPQPEIQTRDNAFSTFSLNVSDVSFKMAQASLGNGQMPAPASIRSEEFINAFDYRDPEPLQGQPLSFAFERARDPFEQERDFLRFSIKAAAAGRQEGRALNLVLLLDTSGSMERADRVAIIREALRVLSAQLQPQDTVSVVTFARVARLWADGVPGDQAGATLEKVGSITPEGGTNLEEAMRLAYETALRHFIAGGMNRVVLMTDGAANLGNVDPQALAQKVEAERRKGIAFDCFGIGWEDYNDDLLEELSSNGNGRYAFINSPDEAATEFATKLAGALQVAAEDVKVQVEFNPDRVTAWRQIGYAKHQLTKEQFRDNSVAAGVIAAREAGNALYVIETRPDGEGPIATVRVRYRVPGTQENYERSWLVDYTGAAPALEQASPAMRLAATAAEFSEWLADSPFAQDVTPDELLNYLSGVPQFYGTDERPKQLEWMIRQAKSVSGK